MLLFCLLGAIVAVIGMLAGLIQIAIATLAGRSNCFLYAWSQHRRYGDHLVVSASRFGWWLHFRATKDFRVFTEYHPVDRKRKRILPPLLFTGYVREVRL